MNMQVQFWLDEQKRRSEAAEASLRRSHLTRLGLVDPDTKEPYDVSDEEYAEICRYAPPVKEGGDEKPRQAASEIDDRAEKWLHFFARLSLALGIIFWVVSVAGAILYAVGSNLPIAGMALAGLFGGFLIFAGFGLSWAVLKTFANISFRLKELR